MDRKEINSEVAEGFTAYMVYVDYEDDRIIPTEVEFYRKPEDALKRANEIKDSFLKDDNWCIGDEADAAEITEPGVDILFRHRDSYPEAYVSIHQITLK